MTHSLVVSLLVSPRDPMQLVRCGWTKERTMDDAKNERTRRRFTTFLMSSYLMVHGGGGVGPAAEAATPASRYSLAQWMCERAAIHRSNLEECSWVTGHSYRMSHADMKKWCDGEASSHISHKLAQRMKWSTQSIWLRMNILINVHCLAKHEVSTIRTT